MLTGYSNRIPRFYMLGELERLIKPLGPLVKFKYGQSSHWQRDIAATQFNLAPRGFGRTSYRLAEVCMSDCVILRVSGIFLFGCRYIISNVFNRNHGIVFKSDILTNRVHLTVSLSHTHTLCLSFSLTLSLSVSLLSMADSPIRANPRATL